MLIAKKRNSIEQMEKFISEKFPDTPEYARGKKFPPGHRIRIQNFVEEVEQKIKPSNRKASCSSLKKMRKR